MPEINQTERASRILHEALECSLNYRHEFIMPEHLLHALIGEESFYTALSDYCDPQQLKQRVEERLSDIEPIPADIDLEPEISVQMGDIVESAINLINYSSATSIDMPHLVQGLLSLDDSWASYLLKACLNGNEAYFLSHLLGFNDVEAPILNHEHKEDTDTWRQLVTCMNDYCMQRNPLIGRKEELTRTIQVLCRRDKNNPLHVGEPGVGKTALVWGIARMIEEGDVPQSLKGSRIYQIDMGSLVAGTQFRGDFEKRIKQIMDGILQESSNNIVYIDEIHTLVGAGATHDNAMDASNMLKPYLEMGSIRFIGSTTYEEYNHYFSRSKGPIRRFQQIDILEPSIEETKHIIQQLRPIYEQHHGISYDDEAISYAVESSAKHINNRFLPDKALDLIDEAGAAMQITPQPTTVGKREIADVLSKICKVSSLAQSTDGDLQSLETLATRMLSHIYGQEEAIRQVVEAVQMSKAGLLEERKPLASLLFVGPTGVGKTEVARVLAKELGIELIRFDMSEYAEKHAVAKLIGSPAGYVGYEDGGLLTDAVRKTPNCVLLLDEIEKAHQDIYNILLQVMDYARLTDNKGRHADFRNVILIMTSNAGAQFASQASVGFVANVGRGGAMMKQVKKTFKPEFINRLSGAVIFNDMDRHMATLILKKKLGELEAKLKVKNVEMQLTPEAFEHLLNEGYIVEYGAREMERVISQQLKPLLMRELLFGRLKNGGKVIIDLQDGSISIR